MATRLILFDGDDVFLAAEVVYAGVNENCVEIFLRGLQESFDYEFATEIEAKAAFLKFVAEWKAEVDE